MDDFCREWIVYLVHTFEPGFNGGMAPLAPVSTLLGADPSALSDDALLAGAAELGELKRHVEAALAGFAAEMKHRSRPEAGFAGLAQSRGVRTTENLVQVVAGTSKREATTLVRVGELLTVDADPWLAPVGSAVSSGRVSVEKADAIRAGLGAPTAEVAADDLLDAAAELATAAPELTVEQVAARARAIRDDLHAASVHDRAAELRQRRYLHFTRRPDGMDRVDGLMDPDTSAIVRAIYDQATSPRRGGPRFVDPEAVAEADELTRDSRTIGQLTLDTFVDLLRLGAEVSPSRVMGSRRHAVQVLVTERDLRERTGAAFYRDHADGVPLETAERHICDAGLQPILFDEHGVDPLRVGRAQRLFTARQREALAARDGGCRFPGCDRPVSWCEAHHIVEWSRGGPTDVESGVLLCRHHHMLVHDNGWRIERDPVHRFVAIPPRSRDPRQRPIPMPTRSRVAERLHPPSGDTGVRATGASVDT